MKINKTVEMLLKIYNEHERDLPGLKKELNKLIKQGRETGDFQLIGSCFYFLAFANWRDGGERDAVLLNSIKAVAMTGQTKDYKMLSKSWNMLGIAHHGQENYQMALDCYYKAYKIAKKSRNNSLGDKIMSMNNIADCYYEMGDYKSSRRMFENCIKEALVKTPHKKLNIIVYSINLANCCEKIGSYEEGLAVLDRIAEWVDELNVAMWVCLYYSIRACIYYATDRRELGNNCVDKALDSLSDGDYSFEVGKELENVAHVLLSLGDFERAKRISEILDNYSASNGHTIDKLLACRVRTHYYVMHDDCRLALENYELLDELYMTRMKETKAMQLTIHKKMKEADNEISKLNRSVKASKESASKESLTGLLNRSALMDTASKFIEIAAKKKEKVGAVFLDIDYFKQCNDTYGHAQGDEVIRQVAKACMEEENANVRFARYGGDEFFGIMHGLSDEKVIEIARNICEKIRGANIPNEKNPNGHVVTLSAGVVNENISERTGTIIDFVNFADKALYHAKDSGRDAIYLLDYKHMDDSGHRDVFVKIDRSP